jgi:hypothetical protein
MAFERAILHLAFNSQGDRIRLPERPIPISMESQRDPQAKDTPLAMPADLHGCK